MGYESVYNPLIFLCSLITNTGDSEVYVPKRTKPLIAAVFPNTTSQSTSTTEPIQAAANSQVVPAENVGYIQSCTAAHTPVIQVPPPTLEAGTRHIDSIRVDLV